MKTMHKLSEHNFEYCIESADNKFSDSEINIYFERDTSDSFLSYRLFLTLQERNKVSQFSYDPSFNDRIIALPYNEATIVFDSGSVDCLSLSNQLATAYKNAEIKVNITAEEYIKNGCRVLFSQLDKQFSGVGQIMLYKKVNNQKLLAGKFFFATNELSRIKVDYYFKNSGNGLDCILMCKDKGAHFDVLLLENENRLPCLKGDMVRVSSEPITVDFANSERQSIHFSLGANKLNRFYSLVFANSNLENVFLLNLLYEDKFDVLNLGLQSEAKDEHFCPFCGEKLRKRSVVTAYEDGAVACGPMDLKTVAPKIYNSNGEKEKRTLFCRHDLEINNDQAFFNAKFLRIFPKDFYSRKSFKINILGSVRSGKTTFLSRFFGLSLTGNKVSMNLRHLSNSMNKFGVSLTPAVTSQLTATGPGIYKISDTNYIENCQFYKDRAIDLASSTFPMATPSGVDCSKYPFIVEAKSAKGDAYISFYDIPGEDARSKQYKADSLIESSGIFLFINALKDAEGNAAIINSLKSANLPKDTPIAVILSKFDIVENNFLDSTHVKRTDYYDLSNEKDYVKGIGREILASSMEVKSYLRSESMILDLETNFTNVMYFALSSFSFPESINDNKASFNDPGRLNFENSPKRIELPFLWMLKQFNMY